VEWLPIISSCSLCDLCNDRTHIVSPCGPVKSDFLFVGEAPGGNEDKRGVPFIGNAGDLLDGVLQEVGLDRTDVCITNIVLCRPPKNRNPLKTEIEACKGYLHDTIKTVDPKVIIALGLIAYQNLTGEKSSMTSATGKPVTVKIDGIDRIVVPTFHPAAALPNRDPGKRQFIVEAITMAKNLLSEYEQGEYVCVDTPEKFQKFFAVAETWNKFAYDIETTGLDPYYDEILGIAFCGEAKKAYYVPLSSVSDLEKFKEIMDKREGIKKEFKKFRKSYFEYATRPDDSGGVKHMAMVVATAFSAKLPVEPFWGDSQHSFVQMLARLLLDETKKKAAHNGKFDIGFLKVHWNIDIKFSFDTLLAASILFPLRRSFALKGLVAAQYPDLVDYKEEVNRGRLGEESLDKVSLYACKDADGTFRLASLYARNLLKEPDLLNEFKNVLMPVTHTLSNVWINGIGLDLDYASKIEKKFKLDLDNALAAVRKEIGNDDFNPNSSKQLVAYFVDQLHLPVLKTTAKGNPSCDKDVLEKYAKSHPVAEKIRHCVHLRKLLGTYILPVPLWQSVSGRVLVNLHQFVAVTSRLSSSDPNMQNIPIRSDEGKLIRGMFIAKPGHVLVGGDLSQAELRILAWFTNDPVMLEACRNNFDLHEAKAQKMWPNTEITPELRRKAKDINFAIVYGAGAQTIAASSGLSLAEAERLLDDDKKNSPEVWQWIEGQHEFAMKYGYIQTAYGRKIPLPDLKSDEHWRVAEALRCSQNYPIQGTSSQYTCLGMVEVAQLIQQDCLSALVVLQLHDAVYVECRKDIVDKIKDIMNRGMTSVKPPVDVPMKVDVKVGERWSDLE